jgi:hypothetical protein
MCTGTRAWDRKSSRTDADTQNTDPHIYPNYLKIPVDPPYLKSHEPAINDLGLPIKNYYTTADLCKVLNIKPDTFRYRIRAGFYPEARKIAGKRIFTEKQIKELIELTKDLINKGILSAGKPD